MPQVSKYPVSKEVYARIFDVFLKTIAELKTRKQVGDFFREFLSPTEQVMLAKRLAVAFLLAKGYEYREISKILRVSTTTVGSVAISYKYGENYRRVVDNILKDEKFEKFLLNVGEKVTSLLAAGGSKSKSWVYLREELRKKKSNKPF